MKGTLMQTCNKSFNNLICYKLKRRISDYAFYLIGHLLLIDIFLLEYLEVISVAESTSTFPITALPSYSVANSSMIGAIWRQGPHHCAQKSKTTNLSDCKTAFSKVSSV